MKIIRDEETYGIMMIPLFMDWGIRRCNVKGCISKPTTIITEVDGHPGLRYGLCENHYKEGRQPGGSCFTLVFDDFDAFAKVTETKDIDALCDDFGGGE